MSVHSFTATPPRRFDSTPKPWTEVRIEESAPDDGTVWNEIETQPLSPVDTDPGSPRSRSITTEVAALAIGLYRLTWIDGDGDESPPSDPVTSPGDEGAIYASVRELRTELGVDDTVLPEARAVSLIVDAEDIIDSLLGAATSDPDPSGRKVAETDVEAWQWTKLSRATVKVAASLFGNPGIANGRQWKRESGPDFEFWDPTGTIVGSHVLALLNDSGLRRLAGRATPGLRFSGGALTRRFFTQGQPRA